MGVFSRANKQAQKSVAQPEPVDPSAAVKTSSSVSEAHVAIKASPVAPATPNEVAVARKVGCSFLTSKKVASKQLCVGSKSASSSGLEANVANKALSPAPARGNGLARKVGYSFLASKKTTSKQATTEQWSWLPRVFQKRSCSAPKKALRKRSRSVPKSSDAQKPVLEAKPACTPWRPIDDFEAAASGDTQAMLELLPYETVETVPAAAPVSLPVSSAADVPVSSAADVPVPSVADAPPTLSSYLLWQCMAPNTDTGSELPTA